MTCKTLNVVCDMSFFRSKNDRFNEGGSKIPNSNRNEQSLKWFKDCIIVLHETMIYTVDISNVMKVIGASVL